MTKTTTAAKITTSQVMMNQDIMDTLITEYHRATTTDARRVEIAAEYRSREAENVAYFEARRPKK